MSSRRSGLRRRSKAPRGSPPRVRRRGAGIWPVVEWLTSLFQSDEDTSSQPEEVLASVSATVGEVDILLAVRDSVANHWVSRLLNRDIFYQRS
ncbi:hypothetical protein SODALDRAFT_52202 [Sodiomyces alkalinus F11]|uniref:Uncharacterized protein n=1 Tax=Sodiomyces alkalinus (strain CBS 110278 / VKM F-3762 / F11) TaxID=1314773 RepID=A0A3N2PMS8_SODAK|nr:hypothetical protein SODALDRAFT_52202 [Sodiomyces alkalinus F11]ROT35828.1 hypothetical protein SODALDRAFT_52202 [Sodiomyces alkalinus F11]